MQAHEVSCEGIVKAAWRVELTLLLSDNAHASDALAL